MKRFVPAAAALSVLAGVTAAAAVAAGGTTIKLASDPVALKFSPSALNAKAGLVTLVMSNPSMLQHSIAIKGKGIKTVAGKIVGKGGVSTVSVTLKPGVYTFFCTVPGHEAGGQKGTLTVK